MKGLKKAFKNILRIYTEVATGGVLEKGVLKKFPN